MGILEILIVLGIGFPIFIGMVLLIANKKTRPVGLALLCIPLLLGVAIAALATLKMSHVTVRDQAQTRVEAAQMEAVQQDLQLQFEHMQAQRKAMQLLYERQFPIYENQIEKLRTDLKKAGGDPGPELELVEIETKPPVVRVPGTNVIITTLDGDSKLLKQVSDHINLYDLNRITFYIKWPDHDHQAMQSRIVEPLQEAIGRIARSYGSSTSGSGDETVMQLKIRDNNLASSARMTMLTQLGDLHKRFPKDATVAMQIQPGLFAMVDPTAVVPVTPVDGSRPEWVERQPYLEGDLYQWPVWIGPLETRQECHAQLTDAVRSAAVRYMVEKRGIPSSEARKVRLSDQLILSRMVGDNTWGEPVMVSFSEEPWYSVHALVRFGPEFQQEIDRQLVQRQRSSRLTWAIVGFATVIGLLGLLLIVMVLVVRRAVTPSVPDAMDAQVLPESVDMRDPGMQRDPNQSDATKGSGGTARGCAIIAIVLFSILAVAVVAIIAIVA